MNSASRINLSRNKSLKWIVKFISNGRQKANSCSIQLIFFVSSQKVKTKQKRKKNYTNIIHIHKNILHISKYNDKISTSEEREKFIF